MSSLKSKLSSAKIPVTYLVVGLLWIALSDHALTGWAQSLEILTYLQTFKGGAFVILTALMLYWMIDRDTRALRKATKLLRCNLEDLVTTQRALQESQERFYLAVSGIHDGLWDWNLDTGHVFYSPVWMEILGYADHSLPSAFSSWSDRIHPDDLPTVLQTIQDHIEGKSELFQNTHRLSHKDGHWLWIDARGKCLYNSERRAYRFTGTITDITEQKRTERALDRFFELSPDIVGISDGNGTIRRVNSAWETIIGYSQAESIGKNFNEFLHPDDGPLALTTLEQLTAGKPVSGMQNRYFCKDGSLKWISWTAVFYPDEAIVYATGRDVTQAKLLEEERHKAGLALRESEKRYQTLIDSFPNGVVLLFDSDLRYTIAGGLELSKYGLGKANYEGKTIWESLSPEIAAINEPYYRRVFDGVASTYEVMYSNQPYRVQTVPLRNEQGEVDAGMAIVLNISEYREAERILREQRELLQTILDNVPAMIEILDSTGRHQWVNREWERVLGWALEDIQTCDVLAEFYPNPDHRQRVVDFVRAATRNWEDFRIRLKDGRLLETSWANVRLPDGSTIGIGQDITERKRTEKRLREQAEREKLMQSIAQRIRQTLDLHQILNATVNAVRQLLEADRVIVCQFAPDHSTTVVAESVAAGWPNILGQVIVDTYLMSDPGLEEYLQGQKRAITNIYNANLSDCHIELLEEFEIKAKLVVPILLNLENESTAPSLWGLLVAHQCSGPRQWKSDQLDLLDQLSVQLAIAIQQSELYQQVQQLNTTLERQVQDRTAQLEQTLSFSDVLKRITDKVRDSLDEDQILQVAVVELLQALHLCCCDIALYDHEQNAVTLAYESTNEAVAFCGDVVSFDAFSDVLPQLSRGETIQFCEARPKVDKTGWVPRSVLSCPIVDDQQMLGDLWLFREIDETFSKAEIQLAEQVAGQCAIAIRQARLYQSSQAQIQELKKLHTLKDDFLNTVSHELRTPISNMKMAIHMLRLVPDSERREQYLNILQTECRREFELINDLLDLQRLDAERYDLSPEAITLQEWLPKVVEPFFSRAQTRQQILHVDFPTDSARLVSDPNGLGRILAELLHNACKYTPAGGHIYMSVRAHQNVESEMATAPTTIFEVRNQAEIPELELPRIFEKFYRVPSADPWKQGGTGLGLALVEKLVCELQGKISVESRLGWTAFTIELTDLMDL